MDQMADEMTLRADVKGTGRVNTAEESSTWVRGERTQSESQVSDWILGACAETEPGETSRDTGTQRPRECDSSSSPLFSLKMYLRKSSSPASSTTDSLSSSQRSNMGSPMGPPFGKGCWEDTSQNVSLQPQRNLEKLLAKYTGETSVDCAGIVLSCLFCRFYEMILMLPDSCERVANHCCPNYKQVIATMESTAGSDDSGMDLDCGLFSPCHDASDCLELAMEVSELCYH